MLVLTCNTDYSEVIHKLGLKNLMIRKKVSTKIEIEMEVFVQQDKAIDKNKVDFRVAFRPEHLWNRQTLVIRIYSYIGAWKIVLSCRKWNSRCY